MMLFIFGQSSDLGSQIHRLNKVLQLPFPGNHQAIVAQLPLISQMFELLGGLFERVLGDAAFACLATFSLSAGRPIESRCS